MRMLTQTMGLSRKFVAMVGDGENDLAAMDEAALAIAMGNADPTVKAHADVTVRDYAHDGAADAIRLSLREFCC